MNSTTNHETITAPDDLVSVLRASVPKRHLTYAEGQNLAKLQARRARALLHMTAPHADLRWVLKVPGVRVKAMPAHEVHEIALAECSGFTKRLRGGGYFIAVNKNASHTHRRFTLAHEVKHLLDYPYNSLLYSRLGFGDREWQHTLRERIADTFAAHFLVPSTLLKNAWTSGLQDPKALAGLFTVSEEAMRIRLKTEGLLDDDHRPDEMFFRQVGRLPEPAARDRAGGTTIARPRAVIFLRARHLDSDNGRSAQLERAMIRHQRERCREAAEALGAELVREYVEYGGRGSIAKRPQLRLLLDELRMLRDVDYVIVASGDRLARQVADWQAIQFELEAAGAEFVIADNVPARKEVLV